MHTDLTGRQFGSWTVLGEDKGSGRRDRYLICRCTCGNEVSVRASNLLRGASTQCRDCAHKQIAVTMSSRSRGNQHRRMDLTGRVFGQWTALEFARGSTTGAYWLCRCTCGTVKEVLGRDLRNGTSTRCRGCANRERWK